MYMKSSPPPRRPGSLRAWAGVLALAALALPGRSLAQAPTFNTLVKTATNSGGNFPAPSAVGDFNGDTKLDAIVTDGASTVRLMLGNGNGTFSETNLGTTGINPGPIAAADFNGDGLLDAVAVSNGNGSSAPATVLLNVGTVNGLPQFTSTNYNAGMLELRSVTVGDLNGDSRPDFIVGSSHGGIRVFLNAGNGTFTAGQSLAIVPTVNGSVGHGVIVDLNGDGHADYVVASDQSTATNVFWGNGNGTFQTSPLILVNNLRSLAVGDLNGDGKPDLVGATNANNVVVYKNNGGSFSAPTSYSSGGITPLWITVADTNRDGKLDVVVSNSGSNNIGILLGDGTGALGATNLYTVNQVPQSVAVRDFNNDGVADIAIVGSNDRSLAVLLNTTPAPVVQVFGSGISAVTAWDPILPATAIPNWQALGTPTQTTGPLPNDQAWTNPHPASVFPKYTHPWEDDPPMDFDANWINAWSNLSSKGPSGQSWTKYSTTVTGQGSFVLQFVADNLSWIYLDGVIVGNQDDFWRTSGTGRYTINLTGAGPHEIVFIIFDGGGLAGGKFRIETLDSFVNNGGGTPPPPPPPTDTTAPAISVPENITAEATGPDGAAVEFSVSAVDETDGRVSAVARPPSGSLFSLGTTSVGVAATDAAGNDATSSFTVTVRDTIAPALTVPASVTAEATSSSGATVSYAAAAATDAVGVTSLTYSQNSGTQFPLGNTTVTVTAKDAAEHSTSGAFTVSVVDTIAPALTVPANVTAEATSSNGAAVNYVAATASDAVGVTSLTYSQNSGTLFALGTTSVDVTAKDAAGHATAGAFTVSVVDTIAPALAVPANVTAEATSSGGATVTYPAATATDAVGVTSLTYSQNSGTQFALGDTTVTVTAKDAAGHTTSAAFTVSVVDTIAPALSLPASQTIEATSAAGAVAVFNASASDAVGVTSFTVSRASGSTFPIGTTTVTVTAKDGAGHTSTGTFTITVRDTTAPVVSGVTPSSATLWPPNHQMVPITIAVAASDLTGVTSRKIIGVTSNEPDEGLGDGDTVHDIQITGDLTVNLRAERAAKGDGRVYTITVEVRDAYNNVTIRTCTVGVPKSQGK
jgi:hypothetical protein